MEYKKYKLSEIGDIISGATPKTSVEDYFGGDIAWITPADLSGYTGKYISHGKRNLSEKGYNSCGTQLMPEGSVLFSSRAPIGYVAIAANPVCTNQGFKSIVPNAYVSSEYLYYQLLCLKKQIQDMGSGTTFKEISAKKFADIQIVVPSRSEQDYVVSRIEELLSQLNTGIGTLNTIQTQLIAYRRSVVQYELKKEYAGIQWKDTTFGEICDCLDSKRRPVNKKEREHAEGKYPYYGANGETGRIDDYLFDEELVLVCEDETFSGRIKPFSYVISGKSWVNNHAHILRGKKGVLQNKYLNYALSYYPFLSIVTGTTGRKKLTQAALLKAPIKICDFETQGKIVDAIETRLTICDSIEKTVHYILQQAVLMRELILKKAFDGGL